MALPDTSSLPHPTDSRAGPDSVLVLDIGNSSTSAAIASSGMSVAGRHSAPTRTLPEGGLEALVGKAVGSGGVSGAILCSGVPEMVAPAVHVLEALAPVVLVLDDRLEAGMPINYLPPSDLGPDRIANGYALASICRGPSCAVDFGTATTFDVVSCEGQFLGGAIAPGLETGAGALFSRAARLRHPGWEPPDRALGDSTETCLRSGLILGYASLVDGMVEKLEAETGAFSDVIATGGLAGVVAGACRRITAWRPLLTLEGLAAAYRGWESRQGGGS